MSGQRTLGYKSIFRLLPVQIHAGTDCIYECATAKNDKIYAKLLTILPQAIGMIPWLLIFMVVSILSLIYAILLIKAKGKGMAITAMILMIVKYVFFSPIGMLSLFMQQGSSTIQSAWDFVFRFVYLLPLFLIALQGIINLVANAKAKKAPVAAPAAAAEPVEASAEAPAEAPAQDQE